MSWNIYSYRITDNAYILLHTIYILYILCSQFPSNYIAKHQVQGLKSHISIRFTYSYGEPIVSHSKPGMSQRKYINSYEFKIPRVRKKQSDMTCYCIITLWAQVHFGLRQVALIGSSLHTEARSTLGCQTRHCHPCPPRNRYLTVYSC